MATPLPMTMTYGGHHSNDVAVTNRSLILTPFLSPIVVPTNHSPPTPQDRTVTLDDRFEHGD